MSDLYNTGNRNPYSQFSGTVSQYKYLHVKVAKAFGKPSLCEKCKTTTAKRYDWANLGNNYGYPYVVKREDWIRVCRSCHQKHDKELFVGKRFAGRKHNEASRRKTSESMKKRWQEDRDIWEGKMRNQWTGRAT